MKIVIINNPDAYNDRVNFIYDYFKSLGHDVFVVVSDFSHIKKEKIIESRENWVSIKSLPYKKNLSMKRIFSLILFSRNAVKRAGELNPDLLYVLIPPNSLARQASKHKMRHPNIKLIYDLMDVWPEAFPFSRIKNLLPFKVWGDLRNKSFTNADFVLSECDLFRDVVVKVLPERNGTLYLTTDETLGEASWPTSIDDIHLCYLGTINSIIDIVGIRQVVQQIQNSKQVFVHIIGVGESKENFVTALKSTGAEVVDYGLVFDINKKQQIFGQCHFGLNMMKDTVKVGLTTKSLNYFCAGLPLINSIKGDTTRIVQSYQCGFVVNSENVNEVVQKIVTLDTEEMNRMRENTRLAFLENFSKEVVHKKLDLYLGPIMRDSHDI